MTASRLQVRLNRLSLALGLGLLIGIGVYWATGKSAGSALFRGDFPAFYAAAEIVWTGRGTELYNFDLQGNIENRHWPDFAGSFYIFAYPPFFALLLAPLAAFPPLVAKGLAMSLMLLAFLGALLLYRQSSPFLRHHFYFSLFYGLSFAPLLMAIVGVQNTALTLLIFAFYDWARGRDHPALAGLVASMLLFKPQFGGLLFVYLLARGRRSELYGWAIGALLLYLLGAGVLGFSWPLIWLEAATRFGDLNFTINDHNMISLAGLSYWAFEFFWGDGHVGLPYGYTLALGLLLLAFWSMKLDKEGFDLAPPLILLLSPQTLFYDVSIALYAWIKGLRAESLSDLKVLMVIWVYALGGMAIRDRVSFPLFSLLLLLILWLQLQQIRESR